MDSLIQQVQKRMLVSLSQFSKILDLHEGDHVMLEVKDGGLFIKPVAWHDKSQEYFWSEAWQHQMQDSVEDIKNGRYKELNNPDDLFKELDGE